MGGDGADGPVATGPFAGVANWRLTLSEDSVDHLVRGFGLDPQLNRLPTPSEVNACLAIGTYDSAPYNDSQSLASFRNQLEGWHVPPGSTVVDGMHNLVHVWVGGTQGTMLPSTSPNDPIFFLHHCNIDRLWALWQLQHKDDAGFRPYLPLSPLASDPGQGFTEPMIFYDPSLSSTPPWSDPPATPSNVVDHHGLGYIYDFEATPPSPHVMRTRLALATPVRNRVAIGTRDRFKLRVEDAKRK
jgi:tyrosinase